MWGELLSDYYGATADLLVERLNSVARKIENILSIIACPWVGNLIFISDRIVASQEHDVEIFGDAK